MSIWIRLDMPTEQIRIIRQSAGSATVARVMDRAADELLDRIRAVWPVDTGRSIAAWRVIRQGTSLYVRNDVEYTVYVHRKGARGNLRMGWRTIWNEEIQARIIPIWQGYLADRLMPLVAQAALDAYILPRIPKSTRLIL